MPPKRTSLLADEHSIEDRGYGNALGAMEIPIPAQQLHCPGQGAHGDPGGVAEVVAELADDAHRKVAPPIVDALKAAVAAGACAGAVWRRG